jgi:hypothetical protein
VSKTKITIIFILGMLFAQVVPVRQASASVYSDIGRIAAALEKIADELHQQNAHVKKANFDAPGCGQ